MLKRLIYLNSIAFVLAVSVYFAEPERGAMLAHLTGMEAEPIVAAAMTMSVYLLACLPIFFMGVLRGIKLAFALLLIVGCGPGLLGMHLASQAEGRAQQGDFTGRGDLASVAVIQLTYEGRDAPTQCDRVCSDLLQDGFAELVRIAGESRAYTATAGGGTRQVSDDRPADVDVALIELEFTEGLPPWAQTVVELRRLTRVVVSDASGDILQRTALAYNAAHMPLRLYPALYRGFGSGDAPVALQFFTEWNVATSADNVTQALTELGLRKGGVVADLDS
ncbi:MAG: hypothetical protein AAF762_11435 [Pseudomonadota bacterium]